MYRACRLQRRCGGGAEAERRGAEGCRAAARGHSGGSRGGSGAPSLPLPSTWPGWVVSGQWSGPGPGPVVRGRGWVKTTQGQQWRVRGVAATSFIGEPSAAAKNLE